MPIFFYITLFLLLAYGMLIEYYRKSWNELPEFKPSASDISKTPFVTVIIPARNEEKQIGYCLQALINQNYSRDRFEVLVVNDHSTDQTEMVIRSFNEPFIRLINLREHMADRNFHAYKKMAIETAIAQARGDWIMCSDADCIMPPGWISNMVSFLAERQAAFVAAPVKITDGSGLLAVFQTLDFICLQGVTGASVYRKAHSMCNGANLGYLKKSFEAVNGFAGIDHIVSGDDMLLMHKIYLKYPDRVFFLKNQDVIVNTDPVGDWKSFLQQRIRWASKATAYEDKRIFRTLLMVYLLNLFILSFLFLGFYDKRNWLFFLILIIAKTLLEFPFVYTVSTFFKQSRLMKYFFFMQPLHLFYIVITGAMGQWSGYEWKGRKGSGPA